MAVIGLISAKGSPGVTTTAVGLARVWSGVSGRSVVALDLDPVGGDTAAGVLGGALPPGSGVLALATDRTRSGMEAIRAAAVPLGDQALLVPGVPDSARSGAVALAWDAVADALPDLRAQACDVVIDGGRWDGSATPRWASAVDVLLLVLRPSLPWASAARRAVRSWPAGQPRLVIVQAASPYSPGDLQRAAGAPLQAVLPFDPAAAAVHCEGAAPTRAYRRSAFVGALTQLAESLSPTDVEEQVDGSEATAGRGAPA